MQPKIARAPMGPMIGRVVAVATMGALVALLAVPTVMDEGAGPASPVASAADRDRDAKDSSPVPASEAGRVDPRTIRDGITVRAPLGKTVLPASPEAPWGVWGTPYSVRLADLVAVGGGIQASDLAWSVAAMPSWLSLDPATGEISGTPRAAGEHAFSVVASYGEYARTLDFTLPVRPDPVISFRDGDHPAVVAEGVPYRFELATIVEVGGGIAASDLTWRVVGHLPEGLSLDRDTGVIEGAPTDADPASFQVVAVYDRDGVFADAARLVAFSITDDDALSLMDGTLAGAVWGEAYADDLTRFASMAGDVLPGDLEWSVTGLPAGLSADAATGAISGSTEAVGDHVLGVVVRGRGLESGANLVLRVVPAPRVALGDGGGRATATWGKGFALDLGQTVSVSGGIDASDLEWSAEGMPDWLSLDPGTGVVSGTPGETGEWTFTVRARHGSFEETLTYVVTVLPDPVIAFSPEPNPDLVEGQPYRLDPASLVSVGGGIDASDLAWELVGDLPEGLSFDAATGVVSGTPEHSGEASFSVRAVYDREGVTAEATRSVSGTIADDDRLSLTGSRLPSALHGADYATDLGPSASVAGDVTTAGLRWSAAPGTMPAGLSISSSGVISGQTTALGEHSLRIVVAHGALSSEAVFALKVAADPFVELASGALPRARAQGAYEFDMKSLVSVDGGITKASVRWAVASGALPQGLSLDAATGLVSGTPGAAGTASFTVRATSGAASDAQPFTLEVEPNAAFTLQGGSIGEGMAQRHSSFSLQGIATIQHGGSKGDLRWQIVLGSLPSGLSLNPTTGLISGTPASSGTRSFTVRATLAGVSRDAAVSIAVAPYESIAFDSGIDSTWMAGSHFSYPLKAHLILSGAVTEADVTIAKTGGSLPPGTTLNSSTGVISGLVPANTSGNFRVQIRASSARSSGDGWLEFPFVPYAAVDLWNTDVGDHRRSSPMSYDLKNRLDLSGAATKAEISFERASGTLPPGVSLSSSGILSGTPTKSGSHTFSVRARHAASGVSDTASIRMDVIHLDLRGQSIGSFRDGTRQVEDMNWYVDSYGVGQPEFEFVSGTLPKGLALHGDGNLTGTVVWTTDAELSFVVRVRAGGLTDTAQFSASVFPDYSVDLRSDDLGVATSGFGFSKDLRSYATVARGMDKNDLIWSGSGLPKGLSLSSGGILSGTVSKDGDQWNYVAGNKEIRIRARYPDPSFEDSATFSLKIVPWVKFDGGRLDEEGYVDEFYEDNIKSYTTMWGDYSGRLDQWRIVKDDLPPGLVINVDNGRIYGRPEKEGTYYFTVKATYRYHTSIQPEARFSIRIRK